MNKYSYWQHTLYIFGTTDSGVDHHHSVRCTVTVYRLPIWIHCHGNNLWPCHERYADKQVTPKARHNSDGEEP